jgi:hypothetical protein
MPERYAPLILHTLIRYSYLYNTRNYLAYAGCCFSQSSIKQNRPQGERASSNSGETPALDPRPGPSIWSSKSASLEAPGLSGSCWSGPKADKTPPPVDPQILSPAACSWSVSCCWASTPVDPTACVTGGDSTDHQPSSDLQLSFLGLKVAQVSSDEDIILVSRHASSDFGTILLLFTNETAKEPLAFGAPQVSPSAGPGIAREKGKTLRLSICPWLPTLQ